MLSSLSRDEVLLMAAFLRANRAAAPGPGEPNDSTKSTSMAWGSILGDASQFPPGFDAIAVAAALARTGWIVPGSAYGGIAYYTTAAFDGVARLVDFQLARLDLENGDA
jgi:hypothetical protein